MSKKASPFAVGLFTLLGLTLLIVGLIIFGSGRYFADTKNFVLYFEGSVNGLGVGSEVKFRGVDIGSVVDVGVVFEPKAFSFSIPVLIEVNLNRFRTATGELPIDHLSKSAREEARFDLLIDKGLRAELKLESFLTGRLFVEFDFHAETPVAYSKARGSIRELPTINSSLTELTKTLEAIPFEKVAQKVVSSLDAIERILNSPELSGSIRSLEQTLEEVKKVSTAFGAATERISGSLDQTLGETRGLVKEARERFGPLSDNVGGVVTAFRKDSEQLEKVLANLMEITRGRRRLREDTSGLSGAGRSRAGAARPGRDDRDAARRALARQTTRNEEVMMRL
jgi:paraquat-inducible protein B